MKKKARKFKSAQKVSKQETKVESFAEFIMEPPVAIALIVFALIALLFSILEFSKAVAY